MVQVIYFHIYVCSCPDDRNGKTCSEQIDKIKDLFSNLVDSSMVETVTESATNTCTSEQTHLAGCINGQCKKYEGIDKPQCV
jgi:hypothetical protein